MRSLPALLLRCILLCLFPHPAAGQQVADDTGRVVEVGAPPARIVSLAPHVTELLFAIGAGGRLVATVEYSDHPSAARALPRIGGYRRIDLEALLAHRPDLVVAWTGNGARLLERLRELGLPLYVTDPHALEDIPAAMERLGRLLGTQAQAAAAAARFRRGIERLRAAHREARPVRVFYEIWHRPLRTTGGGTFIDQVLRLCGGVNLFGELAEPAPVVSMEAVLARDPDAILVNAAAPARDWVAEWRRQTGLRAVRAGHVYLMPSDVLQRPGPRLVEGAEAVCRALDSVRGNAGEG